MALLVTDHKKPIISTSAINSGTSVFNKGSFTSEKISVETCSSSSPPPRPLLIFTPTEKGSYAVVLFLSGFVIQNNFYSELLSHIASHGYILVAPQLYEFPISGPEEIDRAVDVINWLRQNIHQHLPNEVVADLIRVAVSGHSRGGKAAFTLALGLTAGKAINLPFTALLGVDPVAGASKSNQIEPHILTYEPMSFDMSIPVAVIGSGLGPDWKDLIIPPCAPKGVNHVEFYNESKPPRAHFVAKEYGHMDMLDDGFLPDVEGCICKDGKGPKDLMWRTTGGIAVAFFNAYLNADDSDLTAIVADPSLAPAELDDVEFIPAATK